MQVHKNICGARHQHRFLSPTWSHFSRLLRDIVLAISSSLLHHRHSPHYWSLCCPFANLSLPSVKRISSVDPAFFSNHHPTSLLPFKGKLNLYPASCLHLTVDHAQIEDPSYSMLQNQWWILSPHPSWSFTVASDADDQALPLKHFLTCLTWHHTSLIFILPPWSLSVSTLPLHPDFLTLECSNSWYETISLLSLVFSSSHGDP